MMTFAAIFHVTLTLILPALLGSTALAVAQENRLPITKPAVQDLGNQRYRINHIEIDKATHRIIVPGKILRLDPPLEFLASAKDGMKAYESLLELQASAYEFNLACILIGLDAARSQPPRYHFDPLPAQGDAVQLHLTWKVKGNTKRIEVADLVQLDGQTMPPDEWVYTGSRFTSDGRYLAHLDGTLIGFVHDPASIIEHRSGFGLERFGDVRPHRALLPSPGTEVTLILTRVAVPGATADKTEKKERTP